VPPIATIATISSSTSGVTASAAIACVTPAERICIGDSL
jgi:hypothetical protein